MASKVWKGFLNFGLISIPVYLNVGARGESVGLTNIHRGCGGRVKMPKYCSVCDKKLDGENDLVKGWPKSDDTFVLLEKSEIEALQPASEKVMDISEFVKWEDVDPIYLAESFYLLPEGPGAKAYALLVKAMKDSGRVAIAQLTKSNRENIVLIRPRGEGLMLHFLWYAAEVHQVPEFENLKAQTLGPNEIKLASKLVESLADTFQPEKFEDGYAQRLNRLIESKMDKTVKAPAPVKVAMSASMDITAALTASLARPKRKISLRDEEDEPVAKSSKKKKVA